MIDHSHGVWVSIVGAIHESPLRFRSCKRIGRVGAGPRACPVLWQPHGVSPTLSLADVVYRFKTMTSKRYADRVKQSNWPVFRGRLWQRNYYEHIIRDEDELRRIRQYVAENPVRWAFDRENPKAARQESDEARAQ
jgi:putative transposase